MGSNAVNAHRVGENSINRDTLKARGSVCPVCPASLIPSTDPLAIADDDVESAFKVVVLARKKRRYNRVSAKFKDSDDEDVETDPRETVPAHIKRTSSRVSVKI